MGAYCSPGFQVGDAFCPGICCTTCNENETYCNHPEDANGCWMGSWCAPEGTKCPGECPDVEPAECNYPEETMCWGGDDSNGCAMPDTCIPAKSAISGNNGEACWNTCPAPSCNYDEGQMLCDMGFDYNGCYMGSYCAWPYGDCPATCYVTCGMNE